jgi:FkbM family methyltransferase
MPILTLIKRALPSSWKRSIKLAMGFQDMEVRLRVLQRAGFACTGAVDGGAFSGEWTQMLRRIWDVPILMVEPQTVQQAGLKALVVASHGALMLEEVALGTKRHQAQLLLEETNSRVSNDEELLATGRRGQTVTVDTLDRVMARHTDFHPNLLKLDVQGQELAALGGAADSLSQFEVVVLEVSFIRIGAVPLIAEVVEYMSKRNFRLYDMLPMYYRPLDGALWQADAIFVNTASRLVISSAWN